MTEPSYELLQRVSQLGTISWSGTTWRHTASRRNPLSGEGARLLGGRWNPPELVATLYVATPRETCLAEFRRMAEGQANGVSSFLPRAIHRIELHGVEVVNVNHLRKRQHS